jgi:hypothetical protein
MKKFLLLLLVAIVAVGLLSPAAAQAQRKNVTFLVNTATVPDTLKANAVVVLTGSGSPVDADTVMTSWGAGKPMTNIGGDYWKTTLSFATGDTAIYKIRIAGGGWEKDLSDGDGAGGHRQLIVKSDSTLPLQFWNNRQTAQPQLFRPWTAAADSFINVYFRVNLKAVQDDGVAGTFKWKPVDTDSVAVRGDGRNGDMAWGTSFYLTQEQTPGDGGSQFTIPPGSFFSGRVRFPKSQVNAGDVINYKFLLGGDWGRDERQGGSNRTFTIPVGKKDTTLQWVWYNDTPPFARLNPDTCVVTFKVDLAAAINKGGYSVGDTVQVQSGWFGTAAVNGKTKNLVQVIGSKYQVIDTIVTKVGALLDYQYYTVKLGQTNRENYYNFTFTGPTASEAERRQFLVPSKAFTITDYDTSVISGRREPVFPSVRVLARKVRVTYTVDLRPALYQVVLHNDTLSAIQGTTNITKAVKDSIFKWGVWLNGLAVGGWGNPNGSDWGFDLVNNPIKKMWDDGTHGDKVAHDSIYSVQVVCAPESISVGTKGVVGQVFKFGIYGSDNEGGKGGYGNNHAENIVDTDTSYTIASDFGSINPKFYSQWNYDLHKPILTSVQPLPGVVKAFALEQNYPNPFNPSTTIEFSIPLSAQVQLKVYNILGQEVATLVNENLKVGRHSVTFDASRLASGLYLYKINAGSFVSTKKMLLLK